MQGFGASSPFGTPAQTAPAFGTFGAKPAGFGMNAPAPDYGAASTPFGAPPTQSPWGAQQAAQPTNPFAPRPVTSTPAITTNPFAAAAAPAPTFGYGGTQQQQQPSMFGSTGAASARPGWPTQAATNVSTSPWSAAAKPAFGGATSTFGSGTTAFGAVNTGITGTTQVKYNPTEREKDTGTHQALSYQAITTMNEYANKCFEELRFEDYENLKKNGGTWGSQASSFSGGFGTPAASPLGAFGQQQQKPTIGGFGGAASTSPFGQQPKPAMGGFGTPATTAFGQKPTIGGFGTSAPAPTSGMPFGQTSTPGFSAASTKPFSFSSSTTGAAPFSFGGSTSQTPSGAPFSFAPGASPSVVAPGTGSVLGASPGFQFGSAAAKPSTSFSYPGFASPQVQQANPIVPSFGANPYGSSALFTEKDPGASSSVKAQAAAAAAKPVSVASGEPPSQGRVRPRGMAPPSTSRLSLFHGSVDERHALNADFIVPRSSVKKLVIENEKEPVEAPPIRTPESDTPIVRPESMRPTPASGSAAQRPLRSSPISLATGGTADPTPAIVARPVRMTFEEEGDGDEEDVKPRVAPTLTKPGYVASPPLSEFVKGPVKDFTISRKGVGSVRFLGQVSLDGGLNLDPIVEINPQEISVYPRGTRKAAVGEGLNRPAVITFENCYPIDKKSGERATDPGRIARYTTKLHKAAEAMKAELVSYDPGSGEWVFKVLHFSTYSLKEVTLDDREDEEDVDEPALPNEFRVPSDSSVESEEAAEEGGGDSEDDGRDSLHGSDMVSDDDGKDSVEEDSGSFFAEPVSSFSSLPAHLGLSSAKMLSMKMSLFGSPVRAVMSDGVVGYDGGRQRLSLDRSVSDSSVASAPFVEKEKGAERRLPFERSEEEPLCEEPVFEDHAGFPIRLGMGDSVSMSYMPVGEDWSDDRRAVLLAMLENCLEFHSLVSSEGGVKEAPLIRVRNPSECFGAFAGIIESVAPWSSLGEDDVHSQALSVWRLAEAVWGASPDAAEPPRSGLLPGERMRRSRERANRVSRWLRSVVRMRSRAAASHAATPASAMFCYCSGRLAHEATAVAIQNGDFALATLLAHPTPQNRRFQGALADQLKYWGSAGNKNMRFPTHWLQPDFMSIFRLLSGDVNATLKHVNARESLDWLRGFALFFWYGLASDDPLAAAMRAFDESVAREIARSALRSDNSPGVLDALYHVLKLAVDPSHDLAKVCCPESHSSDPADFSQSWMLGRVLVALQFPVPCGFEEQLCTGFAAQLERLGWWQWAIFVLCHIPRADLRTDAVLDVMFRHAPDLESSEKGDDGPDVAILKHIGIPDCWVEASRALLAHSSFRPAHEASYLLGAEEWQSAHDVIVKDLAPVLITTRRYDALSVLLEPINANSDSISGFAMGAGFFIDFLRLRATFDAIERPPVEMVDVLTSLIERIPTFPTSSLLSRACIAEVATQAARWRTSLRVKIGQKSSALVVASALERMDLLPIPDRNRARLLDVANSSFLRSIC